MTTSLQFSLDRGERQLWSGVPRQGIVLRGADAFMIPFSILWGGFAIFWEFGATAAGAGWFFTLWGIPFVLMGLYMMVGRFFVDARRRARTAYAVTSDRVIINSGLFSNTTKSLNLRTISDVTLQERSNGMGTITFGPVNPMMAMYANSSWPGVPQTSSFEMIPDARSVYNIIREAQTASVSLPQRPIQ
jgi:hypothetical protein